MAWSSPSLYGADPEFVSRLSRLIGRSPYAGDITSSSGKRSLADQERLAAADLARHRGDPTWHSGHNVALPSPHAPHVEGIASDLGWRGGSFSSMPDYASRWLHEHAGEEGLSFPMSWEPWHIQFAGGPSGEIGSSGAIGNSGMMGASGADTMADVPTPKTQWKGPNFDPVSGGSRFRYRFNNGQGEFKTSKGKSVFYSEPSSDPMAMFKHGTASIPLPGLDGSRNGIKVVLAEALRGHDRRPPERTGKVVQLEEPVDAGGETSPSETPTLSPEDRTRALERARALRDAGKPIETINNVLRSVGIDPSEL